MATSSITKNFVISGKEQVESRWRCSSMRLKNLPRTVLCVLLWLKGEEELRKFMKEWEKASADQ